MNTTFEKGKSYNFNEIEEFVNDNQEEITMEEYGEDVIGEGFIVLKEGNNTVSFMLDGVGSNGFTYQCIFKYVI